MPKSWHDNTPERIIGAVSRGGTSEAVNFRRGLLRIWAVLSAFWIATWAFYIWNSRLVFDADKTGRQIVAYHTDFGRGWKELSNFSVSDYLSVLGTGIGLPIAILGIGAATGWAIAGFRRAN